MGRKRLGALSVLLAVLAALGCSAPERETASTEATTPGPPDAPNVVVVLTDDLDDALLRTHLDSYPNIRRLYEEGTSFRNSFVTNSLCCPSRSTGLTGRYSHNHGVMDNTPPNGGAPAFRSEEADALPVWLDRAGYTTGLVGKYMNNLDETHVPPGWDEWRGHAPGDAPSAASSSAGDGGYPDDRYADQAVSFVERHSAGPYYLQVSLHAPHASGEGQPDYPDRYASLFPDARVPRPASFDEADVSDKPAWVRRTGRLTEYRKGAIDRAYRDRLRAMMAADDAVGRVYEALKRTGELEDTYLVFTSDNGYHLGQHRLVDPAKRLAYEEDIRVPLVVRGPGVPGDSARDEFVLNNDLAPTFADLAGAEPFAPMDGRSLLPLLRGENPPWRTAFLIEASADERIGRPAFRAIRTTNYLYVDWGNQDEELYNVARDPEQLRSRHEGAGRDLLGGLRGRLSELRACEAEACRKAEGPAEEGR